MMPIVKLPQNEESIGTNVGRVSALKIAESSQVINDLVQRLPNQGLFLSP